MSNRTRQPCVPTCVPRRLALGNLATWHARNRNTKTQLLELARDMRARMPSLSISKPATWFLAFRAEGDGPPVEIRVRRLLKRALRGFGLRCVDYRVDPPVATASPARPIVEGSVSR